MVVWVIESEDALRILLLTNLNIRGYTAVVVEHVQDLSLETTPPDVIFLEVNYDNHESVGFLSMLATHAVFCKVPVVIITTLHQEPQFDHIKHVLQKPFGIDEFFDVLLEVTGDRA